MMGIRWGNGIPSALRGTTAVYVNGYEPPQEIRRAPYL